MCVTPNARIAFLIWMGHKNFDAIDAIFCISFPDIFHLL